MKHALVTLSAFLFVVTCSSAQQADGIALIKAAAKALTVYNLNPADKTKLDEAVSLAEQAFATPAVHSSSSAWLTRAEVYNTRVQHDMAKRLIDNNAALSGDNDALVAFEAFKKCYGLSDKEYEKTDALKGIGEVQGHLINIGVSKYEAGEYEKAFLSFRAALESHELLKVNNQKSLLDEAAQLEDMTYTTGLTALMAKRFNDALMYFDKLYKAGTTRPEVYEGLYNCKLQLGDEAAANKILAEGRQKFPDDTSLLFAEINAYLKSGRLDELTIKLKQAIAREPSNISLYTTLGNVYDNLCQRELKANNATTADAYFEEAKKYYATAIDKDPRNQDALYSMGALYYNKAAFRATALNEQADDFSAAGIKRMEELRTEIFGLFDQALPYFKKSESLDPNDLNTLIALQEIYTRKGDAALAQEFRKRVDIVKNGGKNQAAYFKQ